MPNTSKKPNYNTNASTSQAITSRKRQPKPPPINTKGSLYTPRPLSYKMDLGEKLPIPKHIKTTNTSKIKVAKPLKNVKWDPVRNRYVRTKKK